MREHQSQPAFRDLLRLSPSELQAILADLRLNDGLTDSDERRVHERNSYNEDALLLFEVKSKTSSTPFRVKCVDISAGGLGLLHGAFVHTGRPCMITLITHNKSGLRIKGKVARCIHVRRHVHLIGVEFNDTIDESQLARLAAAT